MGMNARKAPMAGGNKGPKQEPIPAGTYPCRTIQLIDLGVQEQRPYQGEEKPPAHELMLTYEFLDEFCLDENGEEQEDKPRWLSETFPLRNLEQDLAKSTKRYKALDPDEVHEGEFAMLVNIPCDVAVVENPGKGKNAGNVYNNINNVTPMRPKDAKKAVDLVNPSKVFSIDEPDMEVFFSLPTWVQDKIKANLDYECSDLQELVEQGPPVKDEEEKPKKEKKGKKKEEEDDEGWA